jgi:alpha-mannosidase
MWDFKTLHQLTESLPWDSPLTNRALYVANEIMNAFDPNDLKSLKKCRELAEGVLGEGWEGKVEQARVGGEDKDGTLWGVGHW